MVCIKPAVKILRYQGSAQASFVYTCSLAGFAASIKYNKLERVQFERVVLIALHIADPLPDTAYR